MFSLEKGRRSERDVCICPHAVKRHLGVSELRADGRTVNRDGRRQEAAYCSPRWGQYASDPRFRSGSGSYPLFRSNCRSTHPKRHNGQSSDAAEPAPAASGVRAQWGARRPSPNCLALLVLVDECFDRLQRTWRSILE
jgi:hypothetical protein